MNLPSLLRKAEALFTPSGEQLGSGLELRSDQRLLLTTAGQRKPLYADADEAFMPVTAAKQHRHRQEDEKSNSSGSHALRRKWDGSIPANSPAMPTLYGAVPPHGGGEPFTMKAARLAASPAKQGSAISR